MLKHKQKIQICRIPSSRPGLKNSNKNCSKYLLNSLNAVYTYSETNLPKLTKLFKEMIIQYLRLNAHFHTSYINITVSRREKLEITVLSLEQPFFLKRAYFEMQGFSWAANGSLCLLNPGHDID